MRNDPKADAGSEVLEQLDYRSVFESAADGILVVAENGKILEASPEASRQFGYSASEFVGMPVERLVPEHLRASHVGYRQDYDSRPVSRLMGIGMELRGRRKNGTEIPIEISLSTHVGDGASYVICVVRDMTERLQLRAFGMDAIRGAERERRRIAQELHDDTAQLLSGVLVRLKLLVDEKDPARRTVAGEELRGQVREAADGIRRIARGLRPPALEDAGVVTALRGHAEDFLQGADLEWHFHSDPIEDVLDEDAKLVLYRVFQEAVTNVVRHAHASSLAIRIERKGQEVITTVSDDGKGYDVESARSGSGLGLLGMRERAIGVGGGVSHQSKPGDGTSVVLTLPIHEMGTTNG